MGTRGGLLRPRKFEHSSGQVTLNRIEVTISHFPARLGQIPIELALNIGNEIVRLLHNRKASDGRLVRPPLRGALLGFNYSMHSNRSPWRRKC